MGKGKRELLESIFRAAIREAGLPAVTTALHNACVHGEEFSCTDEGLEQLFVHLEALTDVARRIEEI